MDKILHEIPMSHCKKWNYYGINLTIYHGISPIYQLVIGWPIHSMVIETHLTSPGDFSGYDMVNDLRMGHLWTYKRPDISWISPSIHKWSMTDPFTAAKL